MSAYRKLRCERCGAHFQPSGPNGRYCSPACLTAPKATRWRRFGRKPCGVCGETFLPHAPRHWYCSPTCAKRARVADNRMLSQAYRAEAKRDGYCFRCYKAKADAGYKTCALCRARNRDCAERFRLRRTASGLA